MYELRTGWRYLYDGKRDRVMLSCAAVSLVVALGGLVLLSTSNGTSRIGLLALLIGLISTAFFGLLSFLSVFISVSVFGVALGVAALTFVLALTSGFKAEFRDKVLGVNAHVIVQKSQSTFAEYRDTMKIAAGIDPEVLAVQPFIFAEMLVTRGKGSLSGVAVKGVDPELVSKVLDLASHMQEGTVASLAHVPGPGELPPTIIGIELAHKLKAKLGDAVTVVVPLSNINFDMRTSKAPRTRKFKVTGIFYSGFDEYDRRLMYTSLHDIQDLEGRGDEVMGVELKVRDVDRASEIAAKLEKALGGPPFQVQDWFELNHNLFAALSTQQIVLVIILTLIIAVAAFNMVAALTMLVTDKTREIAILKSMGATSFGAFAVFQIVGLTIGAVGTSVGLSLGLATCYAVRSYEFFLDPKVYLIDRLPIEVTPLAVLAVAAVTMLISAIATVVPSLGASSLRPVEGLRYD